MMAKSVFHDLFPAEEAAELEMRAKLLSGINKWLKKSGLTQTEAAEHLGITLGYPRSRTARSADSA
jgi:predicted XRE-type DNA-binding protein